MPAHDIISQLHIMLNCRSPSKAFCCDIGRRWNLLTQSQQLLFGRCCMRSVAQALTGFGNMHTSDAPLPGLLSLPSRENDVHVDSSRSDPSGLAGVTGLSRSVQIVWLVGNTDVSRYPRCRGFARESRLSGRPNKVTGAGSRTLCSLNDFRPDFCTASPRGKNKVSSWTASVLLGALSL